MDKNGDIARLDAALRSIAIGSIDIERTPDGVTLAAMIPFEYRMLEGALELHVVVDPASTTFVLATQIHDADPTLLDDRADEFGIQWEIDDGAEDDVLTLLIGHEVPAGTEVDVSAAAGHLTHGLAALLEHGAVQLVDVRDVDEGFEATLMTLGPLKRENPAAAAELLEELAQRAHDHGARSFAAELRIARAGLLTDLGIVGEASRLAEREWTLLGEPVHRTDLVASYAGVLARAGDVERAIELTRACIDLTDDREGRAALLGNMGTLLYAAGRRSEAVEWLGAAIEDPFLNDADREIHSRNLSSMRGESAGPALAAPTGGAPDVMIDTDRWIDATVHRLTSVTSIQEQDRVLDEARTRLREHVDRWDVLGPAQRVRLLLLEAQLEERVGNDFEDKIVEAASIATRHGDRTLIQGVEEVGRLLGMSGVSDPSHAHGPWEHLAITSNRVHREMRSLMERANQRQGSAWLEQLLEALDAAGDEIRSYGDVVARDEMRRISRRALELAIGAAHLSSSPSAVLDVLERLRDQGSPQVGARDGQDELEREVAERARRVSSSLPVSTSGRVRSAPARTGDLDVGRVADAVAGPRSWWWSAHLMESRLHWALWAPDGRTWAGLVEHAPALARWVRSGAGAPADPTQPDLRAELAAIAHELLPAHLVRAADHAASTRSPIRVACAFSIDIGTVPIALLPLPSGARLIDGVIAAKAPPPWAHRVPGARADVPSRNAVSIALGGDPRIRGLDALRDGDTASRRRSVLGGPAQVTSGWCDEIATPEHVERSWASGSADVGVFYGHMVAGTASAPLGGGLELSDERGRPSRWTVASMLAAEPGGLAPVVVLAGCASMGFGSRLSTEWWGPACGLLWRGARYVIGTQRDVPHSTENVAFVADLVRELEHAGADVPSALRDVQLVHARRPGDGGDRRELPVWSAYSAVGAAPVA